MGEEGSTIAWLFWVCLRFPTNGNVRGKGKWLTQEMDLGKRLVEVQTSLAIIHSASGRPSPLPADLYERVPFQHPALDGLPSLTAEAKDAYRS